MKKQIIRLTESDLHKIIKESVNRIIKESWHDELSSLYDNGKKDNSTGVDLDKVSGVLKKLKRQYGKDTEGYKQAVNKFFNDREKKDDFEKAKKDPAFELWSDEFDTEYSNQGYPSAADFKPFSFDRKKYNSRIKNGETPKALKRSYTKNSDSDETETQYSNSNSPYKDKSPEEIEQMMRDMGFTR